MKNSNYIINGILAVAVIVLFILHFIGKGSNAKSPESESFSSDSASFHLPLAYIRTDSLLPNYKFYNDLSDEMSRKRDDKMLIYKRQEDKFQKEVLDFQEKVERNIFYSKEKQQQEENRLVRMRQELEKTAATIEQELSLEFARMQQQLNDTIKAALRLYNTPKKYEMIFSNVGMDNILYADDSYDITNEVTEFLNARYVPEKK